jgi:hypothetical protein
MVPHAERDATARIRHQIDGGVRLGVRYRMNFSIVEHGCPGSLVGA